jgi:NAD(P)H-flavin reductase
VFSGHLTDLHAGDHLTVRGPQGSFWTRDGNRPLLLIGGGVGLGPLLAMLHTWPPTATRARCDCSTVYGPQAI